MTSTKNTSVGFVLAFATAVLMTGCERRSGVETTMKEKANSQTETMKRRFEEYITALNNHNREKAMGFLAADFQLRATSAKL